MRKQEKMHQRKTHENAWKLRAFFPLKYQVPGHSIDVCGEKKGALSPRQPISHFPAWKRNMTSGIWLLAWSTDTTVFVCSAAWICLQMKIAIASINLFYLQIAFKTLWMCREKMRIDRRYTIIAWQKILLLGRMHLMPMDCWVKSVIYG